VALLRVTAGMNPVSDAPADMLGNMGTPPYPPLPCLDQTEWGGDPPLAYGNFCNQLISANPAREPCTV